MSGLSSEELRDLLPGYAMGTLSLEETRALELALSDAAIAASVAPELNAHRAVIEHLLTSQSVRPSATLRSRVLSRLASDGADSDTRSNMSGPNATGRPGLSLVGSLPGTPPIAERSVASVAQSKRNGGRGGWYVAAALGAALAASVALAVDQRRERASLQIALRDQTALASETAATLAERDRTLSALLDGGNDLTLVRLTANATQGPDMQVFWNTRSGRAVVSASGLRPVSQDRAYCLWIIRDGTPVAVKLFNVDAAGRARITDVVLPTSLAGVAAFAVTEEPASGSAAPTMTPFLLGQVQRGG